MKNRPNTRGRRSPRRQRNEPGPLPEAAYIARLEEEARLAREQLALERDDSKAREEDWIEAQRELEFSRDHYVDLFDTAPIGYLLLDGNGIIRDANLPAARLLGVRREWLIGNPIKQCIAGQDNRKFAKFLRRCRRGAAGTEVATELELKCAGDRRLDVAFISVAQPQQLTGPAKARFRTALLDVTLRKQAEEDSRSSRRELQALNTILESRVANRTRELTRAYTDLRTNEEALADFFDQAPVGLLWVTPEGRIQRANQSLAAMLGCSVRDLSDRPLQEFCPDAQAMAGALQRLALHESVVEYPLRLRRAAPPPDQQKGAHHPHSEAPSLLYVLVDANGLWENGKLVRSRWFVRDVTKRMELQQEVLAIGERVQTQIGRDLHDDLCQQLACVEFASRALERQLHGQPEARQRAQEITSLARKTLNQARAMSHGMAPVDLEKYGLSGALKALAAQTKKIFGIDCRFRQGPLHPSADKAAQIHFYRIAQEAIHNAIKHGKAQRIWIALGAKDDFTALSVENDGLALPPKSSSNGGLGLHIMRYRASSLGGSLAVQNRKGAGVRLTCVIPNAEGTRPR